MRIKYLKSSVASLLILSGLFCLTGCQDDENPKEEVGIEEYVPQGTSDVVGSVLIHIIDEDDKDSLALPLSVLRMVDIETAQNEYVKFNCEQHNDGKWYAVAQMQKALDKPFEVIPVKITPKEFPEKARTVLVVLRQGSAATKAGDAITSVYSEVLGKGTRCYGPVGNTLGSVLLYDQISKLGEKYLTANTTQKQFSMLEFSGDSYEKTMENWSVNVGASFKKTRKKGLNVYEKYSLESIKDNKGEAAYKKELTSILNTKPTYVWTGSFDLGVSGSLSTSESYEYYLNLYRVKMSEVRMNMSAFEQEKKDPTLLALLSPTFAKALNVDNINTTAFFDNWGTDVITQGSFGGYNIYIYGRQENVYEYSVGFDAQGKLRRSKPSSSGKTWQDIYINAHSDYAEKHFDVAYQNENYEKASKAVSLQTSTGGDLAIDDPQKWLDGFNTDGSDSKWALIGYNVSSDEKNDTLCRLYPIEELVGQIAFTYDQVVTDKTEADMEAVSRLLNNYSELLNAKDDYLDSRQVIQQAKSRLVLADILIKSGTNGHKKGEPVPFVAQDPNDQDNYLTYYPIMANPNAPCENGYAFEVTCHHYIDADDYDDKYIYYALAPIDNCLGIVDAVFCQEGTAKGFNGGKYYIPRGVHANKNVSGALDNNYLFVKYYDEGVDHDPAKKITAIGFANIDNKNAIISSTGGSELRMNATQTEENSFNQFWDKKNWNWYAGDRSSKSWVFYEGGLVRHNRFYVVYTTQDLPIKHFRESSVWQPKKWGE